MKNGAAAAPIGEGRLSSGALRHLLPSGRREGRGSDDPFPATLLRFRRSSRHPRLMTTEQRSFARRLRRRATPAEEVAWALLRNRRLDGLRFRRQVPLLGYTVDFIERRLIVELDGVQHDHEQEYDAARTQEIERHGFTVLRFANRQVLDDRDAVVAAIRSALRN